MIDFNESRSAKRIPAFLFQIIYVHSQANQYISTEP